MDSQQKSTNDQTATENKLGSVDHEKLLTQQQEQFISYKAVGGISVEVGADTVRVTMTEFADSIGVDRTTLYLWQKTIPNFWQRVKERREAIGGRDMVANVWQRVYLDAMAGKAEQQKMFLGVFDDWKPPAQSHDVKMTGWADVINSARRRKEVPEGEVVDNG